MCNLYTQTRSPDEIARVFAGLGMPISYPEGVPNLEPREVAITDPAPIVRAANRDGYGLVVRRWSWPGPGGKPVYNFRSDGREFSSGRVLILAEGFYEFTALADSKQRRKDRWLFTDPAAGMIGIAGIVRNVPGLGERFTMLTTEPGSDVSPYHTRQVAVLPTADWRNWLDPAVPTAELLKPAPAGSLCAEPAEKAFSWISSTEVRVEDIAYQDLPNRSCYVLRCAWTANDFPPSCRTPPPGCGSA